MKHFLAVVEKEPDSAFGVWFPDIPGCFSASDEEAGILANAVEALDLWAEDMEVPAPSPYDRIVARPDVAEGLRSGAYLISVPLIEKDTAVVRANLTFERGMLRAIDETAKSRGLTRSAFLADAARRSIGGKR
jgi:predicted RNase H-like HicB family nuclease